MKQIAKVNRCYLPHLTIAQATLPPSTEWMPESCEWVLILVASGTGYWIRSPAQSNQGAPPGTQSSQELEADMVLLLSAQGHGVIRASCLGQLQLHFFAVEPERLVGLLTLSEQRVFSAAACKEEFAQRIFPAHSPTSSAMKELCLSAASPGFLSRLRMLQIFIGAFSNEFTVNVREPTAPLDAKERLRQFLRQTPAADLLCLSVADLAQKTGCTPRHLNRIFNQVAGTSFREKHTELRLTRACELLATTESKVVDVALESGYQSLSLFNLMFTRRFGVSPGKWRQLRRKQQTTNTKFFRK